MNKTLEEIYILYEEKADEASGLWINYDCCSREEEEEELMKKKDDLKYFRGLLQKIDKILRARGF